MKSERPELGNTFLRLMKFFRLVEDLKYRGDASVRAIEGDPSQQELAEKSKQATTVTKILFRLRNEAKTSHRNR